MSKRQADLEDEPWLRSLATALNDPADRAILTADQETSHASKPSRPAWFNVITVCGLVVLLLPVSSSRLREWIAGEVQPVTVAPTVLGWRRERTLEAITFDESRSLRYRGMVEPLAMNPSTSGSVSALNAHLVDVSALAPVRIGFGADLATAPRVRRFLLRNVPATATLSLGRRLPDGTWAIETSALDNVVVALGEPPPQDLAIEIEGQSLDGALLARGQVLFGIRPIERPALKSNEHTMAPAALTVTSSPTVVIPTPRVEPASSDVTPPQPRVTPVSGAGPAMPIKSQAKPRVVREKTAARSAVARSIVTPTGWNKTAFDRD